MKKLNKEKLRELISYAFFGGTTTLVNLFLYQGLLYLGVNYMAANLVAIIAAKCYAYITNKLFVFKSRCNSPGELLAEMGRFVVARGSTGLLDYFGLIFAVEVCGFSKVYSKYALQIIIILLNYVLGKHLVFNKKRKDNNEQ